MTKLSVAIIGAGMGGLATAAALRSQGIEANIYEQATKFTRLGAGIQIGCNAMHVLRGLGLEPVLVRTVDLKHDGVGPEAAARAARFEALEATALEVGEPSSR